MIATLSKRQEGPTARTFVAIELPDDLKNRLQALRTKFGEGAEMLKWTGQAQLHVTLRFLGDVERSRLHLVVDAASYAASQTKQFSLQLGDLGAFPNERSPRVLWVGLLEAEGKSRLSRLFSVLEEAIVHRGFPPEPRAFSPHLTMARARDRLSSADRSRIGRALQELRRSTNLQASIDVRQITVMESSPSAAGARYSPVATLPLLLKELKRG
jgi:RNA 2',3'-cyclic 3'-phosphodiesterase